MYITLDRADVVTLVYIEYMNRFYNLLRRHLLKHIDVTNVPQGMDHDDSGEPLSSCTSSSVLKFGL